MSFRTNDSQQISMFDSFNKLTEREQKALVKSWTKVFAEEIFLTIDEERFAVLYSTDTASIPNTPVNIIIGALILKELLNLSDDEVVENLMLDFRFRYALHTTSFEEQPLSDKIIFIKTAWMTTFFQWSITARQMTSTILSIIVVAQILMKE